MSGERYFAVVSAALFANTLGKISPKNKIRKVMAIEMTKKPTAHVIASFCMTWSPILPAYNDTITFTKLLPMSMVMIVLSGFFLKLATNFRHLFCGSLRNDLVIL